MKHSKEKIASVLEIIKRNAQGESGCTITKQGGFIADGYIDDLIEMCKTQDDREHRQ
jgi:hypothetical protein